VPGDAAPIFSHVPMTRHRSSEENRTVQPLDDISGLTAASVVNDVLRRAIPEAA